VKALSVRQPWAWAILYAGKRIENRTWSTNYRGPLLIHAARGMTSRELVEAMNFMNKRNLHPDSMRHALQLYNLQRGGIVGKCELVEIFKPGEYCATECSPAALNESRVWWDYHQFGWLIDKVEPLPFHPCRGHPGLFEATP